MELRWHNRKTKEIGVALVTDDDVKILHIVGYYHCEEEDITDDELDGEIVEIWKPVNEENTNIEYDFKVDGNKLRCKICGDKVGFKFGDQWLLSSEAEGDESKGICHTCLVEHCCNTNCLMCDWYKYPNCPHIETKKIYMEED